MAAWLPNIGVNQSCSINEIKLKNDTGHPNRKLFLMRPIDLSDSQLLPTYSKLMVIICEKHQT